MRLAQRTTLSISLLTLLTCLASEGLGQTTYTITDLGSLGGGVYSNAGAINDIGQITVKMISGMVTGSPFFQAAKALFRPSRNYRGTDRVVHTFLHHTNLL